MPPDATLEVEQFRCKKCNRLLFKCKEQECDFASAPFTETRDIEILCPKCKYLNHVEV